MKKILLMMALGLTLAGAANAQNVAGDWIGMLRTGSTTTVHLVVHIVKASNGSLTATADCIEQALSDIPVGSISLTGAKLSFTVGAVNGSYVGTVDPSGASIRGTWTQGPQVPLDFKRAVLAKPTDIDGIWAGILDFGGHKLRLIFHFDHAGQGYSGSLDSLDQGTMGMPISTLTRDGSSLKLELKQLTPVAVFEGKIDRSFLTIEGKWSQGASPTPLVLRRSKFVL